MKSTAVSVFNSLIAILFMYIMVLPVFAQSYNDNFDPARSNVIFNPPGGNPTTGLLPPPGDGDASNAANGPKNGDQVDTNPPVPSGTATTSNPGPMYGTYFQHQTLSPRSRVNLLVNSSNGRGTRVALTFQPDQLTSSQIGQVEGQLGLGSGSLFSTDPYQNIQATPAQIEAIQNILFPHPSPSGTVDAYPGTPGDNLRVTPQSYRTYQADDSPATGYPRYASNEVKHPNVTIRQFSKYLVIMGAVICCIHLIFAATMIILGHPYAGGKAMAAASGFMLLLMSFAIWKVDMFNASNARGQPTGNAPDSFNITTDDSGDNGPPLDPVTQVEGSHTYIGDNTLAPDVKNVSSSENATGPEALLPYIPGGSVSAVTSTTARSGLPLRPLGSAH